MPPTSPPAASQGRSTVLHQPRSARTAAAKQLRTSHRGAAALLSTAAQLQVAPAIAGAKVVRESLSRRHELDVFLQLACPAAGLGIVQAVNLDVEAYVVVVTRFMFVQQLPVLERSVVLVNGGVLVSLDLRV